MRLNVEAEARVLMGMALPKLKDRYLDVFGEATNSNHREYLVRRIVWRMQANAEGGLSVRARRRALELANDADLRKGPPRGAVVTGSFNAPPAVAPMPGTLLTRRYKGREIVVKVLDKGFEHDGKVHRSLSSVANAVTGSHWNGRHFFGLESSR